MLWRADGHVFKELKFEVEGQKRKGRLDKTCRKQIEKGIKIGLSMRNLLADQRAL